MDRGDDGLVLVSREDSFVNRGFIVGIDTARRFVEENDGFFFRCHEPTGEGEALLLAAREVHTFFNDRRIESVRKSFDDGCESCDVGVSHDVFVAPIDAHGDIFSDGRRENLWILRDESHVVLHGLKSFREAVPVE